MGRPHFDPDDALLDTLREILESGRATNGGPHLESFEGEAAAYLGARDAVAVASGYAALFLALRLLGVRGGVVLPAYTFAASLNSVAMNGLEPVFCDVEPDSFTLSPDALDSLLRTRNDIGCVMPVNVFGVPPDLEAIHALTRRGGARIVYDNAQGFGSAYRGRRLPDEPDMQIFSLHATKVLPAVEEGLLIAHDPSLLAEARRLRNHGIAPDPLQSTPGINAKLDELRAAIARHALRGLPDTLRRRRAHALRLRGFFRAHCRPGLRIQSEREGVESNFQNLGVVFEAAARVGLQPIADELQAHGVEGRRYFHPALHQLPAHRGAWSLPVTDRIWNSLLCLPLHSRMSDADLERIEGAALAVGRRFAPHVASRSNRASVRPEPRPLDAGRRSRPNGGTMERTRGRVPPDLVSTPIDSERLVDTVTRHCRPRAERHCAILGSSHAIQGVIDQIERAAKTDLTVLVTGESGTGKELAARTLHERSLRAAGAFVAVNCSALPDGVLHSELFGHERGSFTGAHARRQGRFELADGGTVFLDEIGDASLTTQATLLRVLEEREFERVGGLETVRVNVRIVAATNRDLGRAVTEGTFREDLLYRLDVVPLRMPPLRERPEDVPELVEGLLERQDGGPTPTLTNEALLALQAHDWPGNVRQLANFLHRLCVAGGTDGRIGGDVVRRELLASATARSVGLRARISARESFLGRDREEVIDALDETRWNVSAAARRLCLSRSALRYRMEKHGLL